MCDYSSGIWNKGHTQGRLLGREEEREAGIRSLVECCQEIGVTVEVAITQLVNKYQLTQEAAGTYVRRYWH